MIEIRDAEDLAEAYDLLLDTPTEGEVSLFGMVHVDGFGGEILIQVKSDTTENARDILDGVIERIRSVGAEEVQ